jgi:hypothetical protein
MKVNFKPAVDNSEQLNLRISPLLKQRIENLRTRSKTLGLDYNATMVAHFEEFVSESESQLDALEESASKSVAKGTLPSRTPATKSVTASLNPSDPISTPNGADRDLP